MILRPENLNALDGIVAGFSTRHTGVSTGHYASLNTGLSVGDDPENVRRNRAHVLQSVGFSPDRLAWAGQVHGGRVTVVAEPGFYDARDGLVTAASNLVLGIGVADCAAILLADPEAGIIGACHSGWKGTVARISEQTVAQMAGQGANPARVVAWIGPCISAARFEVGPEVAEVFSPEYVRRVPGTDRSTVNLKAAIRDQLLDAGLTPDAVRIDPGCTYSDTDLYFSYRAEGGATGRMLAVIGRKKV